MLKSPSSMSPGRRRDGSRDHDTGHSLGDAQYIPEWSVAVNVRFARQHREYSSSLIFAKVGSSQCPRKAVRAARNQDIEPEDIDVWCIETCPSLEDVLCSSLSRIQESKATVNYSRASNSAQVFR